ncbi:MAG: hypothetical protein ACLRXQ_09970 [Phascolarctobacterium faecium]
MIFFLTGTFDLDNCLTLHHQFLLQISTRYRAGAAGAHSLTSTENGCPGFCLSCPFCKFFTPIARPRLYIKGCLKQYFKQRKHLCSLSKTFIKAAALNRSAHLGLPLCFLAKRHLWGNIFKQGGGSQRLGETLLVMSTFAIF